MKLSFIKLDIDIMNDTKIKIIRKMPAGSDMLVIWIGILCLAMKSGKPGILEVGDGIPFDTNMLAGELDIDINTMKLALETFKKLKMIEIFEDGQIFISNFEKHQEIEKIELAREKIRIRVSKHRKKQKAICNGYSDVTVTECNATEEELDKEKEKEKELDKEKEQKKYTVQHKDAALYLADKILCNDSNNATLKNNYDKTIDRWADDIRKLNLIDDRSLEDIKKVIDFSQHDNFWCSNILSAKKLREKFGTLYLQLTKKNMPKVKTQNKNGMDF